MRRQYLVQFCLFCMWSLLTGFHFPHVQCIDIFVAFSRWHFKPRTVAFLVYCYRVKAVFHNPCTVLYWHLCGLTNSPHCWIPSQLTLMCMERRRFSQTMASEWQTAFVVSHKMPRCALLTAVKNYNRTLEKLQDFFFKAETKTKAKCSRPSTRPRHHDPRSRPRLSFLSSRRLKTKTVVSRTTSLTETSFSSWYCSCNVFQATLTEKKFRPACIEVQMLHHHIILNSWLLPLCKSMLSSIRCDAVSVCLLSWAHTLLKR